MIIIPDTGEKLTQEQIQTLISEWIGSPEKERLKLYQDYYEQRNTELQEKVSDKAYRGRTPLNYVPVPYYATVIDTMAGYMFQNVQYVAKEGSEDYAEELNKVLEANSQPVKDMRTGTLSLAYNVGVEWVYSTGDENGVEIKYSSFDPLEWILIYNTDVEPDVWCGIRFQNALSGDDFTYYIDVIYKDLWQRYNIKIQKGGTIEISQRADDVKLFHDECPVVAYNSEIIGEQSPFHVVLTYIMALDVLMTGNVDEVEKLGDAVLLLGRSLKDEDLKTFNEIKAIQDIRKEEFEPKFIEKQMSPEFREYVSKLLINEIHKHSHVIDWYSPDSGLSGQVSSKALRTRLFDMDMYSRRIEQVYRAGINKRIRLINKLMMAQGVPEGEVSVILNRTVPSDFYDKIEAFKNVDFVSRRTMWEELGLDAEEEEKRLEEQKSQAVETFMTPVKPAEEETEEDA